ncbi:MAG: pirin family protein [Fimbriimonadaceae bacterium]|nr:pirin family protein [Fimbriimonadaceae bacterium]
MTKVFPAAERGHTQIGWLNARHSFSFGEYFDRERMGFGDLRVINDDRVAPGGGFPTHPHRDMEIVTFVVSGRLAHRDSMGSEGSLGRFEVQAMTAGRGITHSEFNPSQEETTRLLQIWIFPREKSLEPKYDQRSFAHAAGAARLIASPDGEGDSLPIEQEARVYAVELKGGEEVRLDLRSGRRAWVQVVEGEPTVQGEALSEGDGIAMEDETEVVLSGSSPSLALVFDLR